MSDITSSVSSREEGKLFQDCSISQPPDGEAQLSDRHLSDLRTPVNGMDAGAVVAASRAMQHVKEQVRQVAGLDIPVLLLGESGTGKEVIARLIHSASYRARRTFMRVNCAALPSELLESELFGHEAGAFTGATRAKPGKFEICQKGTILLDEIAEMPVGPQAKFLHVLQDGEFARLGSPFPKKVDVRVLAATNVDIQEAIANRRFREDLYYRISTYSIYIPPLRERREDIPPLIEHFLGMWASRLGKPQPRISPRLLEACLEHSWPGNVRELENFVGRYMICGEEDGILDQLNNTGACMARAGSGNSTATAHDLKSQVRTLKKEAERQAIIRALEATGGCRKAAAQMLNISLRSLQYKVLEYELGQPASDRRLHS